MTITAAGVRMVPTFKSSVQQELSLLKKLVHARRVAAVKTFNAIKPPLPVLRPLPALRKAPAKSPIGS
jgi:hypothetical protein